VWNGNISRNYIEAKDEELLVSLWRAVQIGAATGSNEAQRTPFSHRMVIIGWIKITGFPRAPRFWKALNMTRTNLDFSWGYINPDISLDIVIEGENLEWVV
jgi:hypothetical protein